MASTLIKIDKNGTEYWGNNTCERCGGAGGSDAWKYTGWTCYQCGGSGIDKTTIVKKYTPEYAAKLQARRDKAAEKKRLELVALSSEANKEFLKNNGFNADGKCYYVLGNTFEIKEELKSLGAKFDPIQKAWRLSEPNEKYPTIEADVSEVYYKDYTETYKWQNWIGYESHEYKELKRRLDEANIPIMQALNKSKHFGEIGKRYTLNLKYLSKKTFAARSYNYYQDETEAYMYKFQDEEENIFIWKTGKWLDIEVGNIYTITGTVKDHDTYNFVDQTWLTRCKVAK